MMRCAARVSVLGYEVEGTALSRRVMGQYWQACSMTRLAENIAFNKKKKPEQ
jgi:hypothetical protein